MYQLWTVISCKSDAQICLAHDAPPFCDCALNSVSWFLRHFCSYLRLPSGFQHCPPHCKACSLRDQEWVVLGSYSLVPSPSSAEAPAGVQQLQTAPPGVQSLMPHLLQCNKTVLCLSAPAQVQWVGVNTNSSLEKKWNTLLKFFKKMEKEQRNRTWKCEQLAGSDLGGSVLKTGSLLFFEGSSVTGQADFREVWVRLKNGSNTGQNTKTTQNKCV